MMLDMKILVAISFTILILTTSVNLFLIYRFPKNRSLKYLLGFNTSFVLGQLLMLLRNIIPDFFSIVLGNSLLAAGHLSLYVAGQGLLKQEMKWHNRYIIPIFVIACGLLFFTYIQYDTEMRIIIVSLFFTIVGAALARLFWNHAFKDSFLLHRISSIFFLFSATLFFVRVFMAASIKLPVYYLNITEFVIVVPYVYLIFIALWICFLFMVQIKQEVFASNDQLS